MPAPGIRPRVGGKFLQVGERKLYLHGVTYGTFRPGNDGFDYPSPEVVADDFAQMAASGLNAVRTYTVPPRSLLDTAREQGLYVMVGIPWEQHVTFLDDRGRAASIEQRVRAGVRSCAGHSAVLCYAVGNEIPAPIVRWHGRKRVERFIERLYLAAKEEDPEGLVTYVNFPSTEYLELPFLDVATFNVYLESQRSLEAYLARLQNLAGERPLVMAEIGLDSARNGEHEQARILRWQLETAGAAGCAGAFVFAWTDEWHRDGHEIEDWDFGLTRRDRSAKPALGAVSEGFQRLPPRPEARWPRVSVVVCSFNGQDTLGDCFDGLAELAYPDYEVIVVNDGSSDATTAIARQYPFRLINTDNRGLGAARNTGMRAASGEIIAYVDDDARPDPDWLTYLVTKLMAGDDAGVGGPNIAPAGDGPIADCVANAPGGPVHVLLSDTEAEHIPGCNMAFRKACLEAVGGFDPRFRAAGDDVDLCWRLRDRGWKLAFHPAAMVWHHRRNSLSAYWRQQRGYGKAEALLERKWPEKYNVAGHVSWGGRLYGNGLFQPLRLRRSRVYYGSWGTGLFQRLYQRPEGPLASMPLTPEWHLLVAVLAAVCVAGAIWRPLLVALPALAVPLAVLVAQAARGAAHGAFPTPWSRGKRIRLRALTACLYLAQPVARLWGRLAHGLTPWRRRAPARASIPRPRIAARWSEQWRPLESWTAMVEGRLLAAGAVVEPGGHFDRWDLQVRGGPLGGARLRTAAEEHGAGRQLIRYRVWPAWPRFGVVLLIVITALAAGCFAAGAPLAAAIAALLVLAVGVRVIYDSATAMGALVEALGPVQGEPKGRL
jgi:O-antigen biosynthesis protein